MNEKFIKCPICGTEILKRYYIEEGYEVEHYITCHKCGYHNQMAYSLDEVTFYDSNIMEFIAHSAYRLLHPIKSIKLLFDSRFRIKYYYMYH